MGAFNRKYSEMWPVIVTKKDPLPEAEERDGETGKLDNILRGRRRGGLNRRAACDRCVPGRRVHGLKNG